MRDEDLVLGHFRSSPVLLASGFEIGDDDIALEDGSGDFAKVFDAAVLFVADAGFHVREVVLLADLH